MLGVVTCLFNPAGFNRTDTKYNEFRKNLRCEHLVTAEISWNGEFTSSPQDSIHLRGTRENILWQKERLLNLAIEQLPPECDKIAWIDADLIFQNSDWMAEADSKLDSYPLVQLFDTAVNLGPDRKPQSKIRSWGSVCSQHPPNVSIHHVGHAWAIRRELLTNGLFDKMVVGGGDYLMANAWFGRMDDWLLSQLPPSLRTEFTLWAEEQWRAVRGEVACVSGEILHLYHGKRVNRQYNDRFEILRRHEFEPAADIKRDTNGIWQWSGRKPSLTNAVARYFEGRDEDDTNTGLAIVQGSTFTSSEKNVVRNIFESTSRLLEFGSGESTLLAVSMDSISSIDTVESCPNFSQQLQSSSPETAAAVDSGRLKIHDVNIGKTGVWGYPEDEHEKSKWPMYAESVHKLSGPWDTILIDGRFRVACTMNLLLRIGRNPLILIHDFWLRNHYHILLNFLDVESSVDSLGVFRKRLNCDDDELVRLRHKFAVDPR